MKPKFEPLQDRLEIVDPIDRHRDHLITHEPVTLQPVDKCQIPYPIDTAVKITTDMITLPVISSVYVRGMDGSMTTEVRPEDNVYFSRDEHIIDISVSIKTYIMVNCGVEIYSDRNQTHIKLEETTQIIIGARSYHTHPARTIKTTDIPTDVMQAVSAFGSTLKTTTVERSFPTMRGHPPTIEVGDELSIPQEIREPKTDIKLVVPSTLEYIFTVTPLAYYLGAEIIPGAEPQLLTASGYSYPLNTKTEFETAVEKILKHIFFLDCIVRTEGVAPLPLHEREIIESDLTFDPSVLYEQSLSKQLETYLEIPFTLTEPFLPEWRLKTQLKVAPEQIPFLPFLANNLAIVKVQDRASQLTRPTVEQFWACQGGSQIESTTPLSAYSNGTTQTPKEDPIRIEVVCNDPGMSEELVSVYSTYGERDIPTFEVTIHHKLTTADLRKVLTRESDFMHYIGHIDSNGFRCSDGQLDVSTIGTVNIALFFLNACQSKQQGIELIEAGSVGGVVTSSDIENGDAVNVGSTIARLLNNGYSLYSAVDIVRKSNHIGDRYHVVGDGMSTVAQTQNGAPNMCSITRSRGELTVEIHEYFSVPRMDSGGISIPYIESIDSYHVAPKKVGPLSVTKPELVDFLEIESIPVLMNGRLRWSDNLKIREL